MMQKIQKFGGAMFTPVLLFAFSGIMVGITTVLTSEVIVGSIAEATTTWYKVWWTVKEGAWTIFRQIPLLFVVSLPIGLAKKQQARACMEALLLYLTFNYFIAAILTNWGTALGVDYSVEAGNGTGLALVASIKTLDTNMVGALVVAGIVVYLHNKYFNTKLPEWLGVFKGSCFVCAIGFFVMLSLAVGAIVAGVTEPAIYGCNLKYKKPMYGVMGGAAIGGIVASLLGARAFVFGYSNLLAIAPMFLSTAWAMFIGAAVSIVAAAIITYVLGIDEGPIKAAKRK